MTLFVKTSLLVSVGAKTAVTLFKQIGLLAEPPVIGGVYTADSTLYTADNTLLTADLT